jgi:hypothetical protein
MQEAKEHFEQAMEAQLYPSQLYFLPALTLAHRARAAAAIRARPAAEMWRLPALIGTTFWLFTLAHRARCAAAIRRRAAADIVRRPVAFASLRWSVGEGALVAAWLEMVPELIPART